MSDHPYAKPYSPHAKTAAILDRAWRYVQGVPYQVSLRWLFYRLYQDGTYRDKSDYTKLKDLVTRARKRFYEGWRPDTLADDTRTPTYRGFGRADAIDWLENQVYRQGCKLDKWQSQPYYVECWYEAAAMHAQFAHYTRHVTLRPFRGDPSLDYKWQIATDLETAAQVYPGKPIIILYFGDLDDKGEQIPESAKDDIEDWSEANFHFIRCGLNYEHVTRYNLPENPESPGSYQWEALGDAEAKQLIAGNLERFVDLDALEAVEAQEQRITERFRSELDHVIERWGDNDRH
jgi:hypothetical protein